MGNIKSVDRMITYKDGRKKMCYGCQLKPHFDGKGNYLHVSISHNRKKAPKNIHRLVAKTFIPNPDNLPCVDHINGNRTDNRASNLRWCTYLQNIHYSIDAGRIDLQKKAELINRPETRAVMLAATRHPVIRSDGKWYESVTSAAADTGCSRRGITLVLSGVNKTCRGYTFSYARYVDISKYRNREVRECQMSSE